jgi:eukaryotic-like serine/threonine-protein kinase
MALSPGTRLGPYEILAPIGAGGMGDVYRARDTRLNREVAIKVSQERFSNRFEREARAIAALNHPNICQLYDVGPNYLVMEYVDGAPVSPPDDLHKLLDITMQAADGLAAAHSAGIIHRDLKPDNILITRDGRVKILDFGLAKHEPHAGANDDTRTLGITQGGTVVGTVAYMSPEQARAQELGAQSDQFSFGLIVYELASGKRAFDRASAAETMTAIIREDAEPLPASIPAPLRWTVERCLAKDPSSRYESTRDLYRELCTLRDHLSQSGNTSPGQPSKPPGRIRWSVVAILVAAGIIAAFWVGALWRKSRIPAEPSWEGIRLGGPRVSMSPRISPDGQLLAFLALVDGSTQLGVMKAGADSWTLLTHGNGPGSVQNVCWSRDGSKLYFDRYWGGPIGVYTIPPLGGEPVLLLEGAWDPQALSDGSLLVLRTGPRGLQQAYRFWPENGKLESLPAFFSDVDVSVPMRPFADGREMVYFGTSGQAAIAEPPALQVLDLETRKVRNLDAHADVNSRSLLSLPLAISADDKSVMTLASKGDTYDLIEVRRNGTPGHRVLLSLRSTELPWYLDVGPDESIYLDQVGRPYSILRFSVEGGIPEESPALTIDSQQVLPLADGRVVLSTRRGKSQVVIGHPGFELRALLQTTEETTSPLAPAGSDAVAMLVGGSGHRRIALASIANGRILREVQIPPSELRGLAVSPDRTTFYYAQGGLVYAQAGGQPKRLAEGDTIALEPAGRYLYAKQMGYNPIRLVRIDTGSGREEEVQFPTSPRISAVELSPTAVDVRGRILLDTTSPSTWFYRAAVLDPAQGKLTVIPLSFSGDSMAPGWTPDGKIVSAGAGLTGSLWRYRQTHPSN